MKKISLANYRTDKYYRRIVRVVEEILEKGDVVAPIDVFLRMGLVDEEAIRVWRQGQTPYLERVIRCNLSEASRILRILRMHVHDLKLRPSLTVYVRHGKGRRTPLRFTKTGDPKIEEAYSRHFLRVLSKRNRQSGAPDERASATAVDEELLCPQGEAGPDCVQRDVAAEDSHRH
ncbi:MAG TPA: hypothetical protein VEK57_12400 [Thermoanaerobaculia bacterium]|nr:hypothetical protein [Thermoanaerobaculia bacterium]